MATDNSSSEKRPSALAGGVITDVEKLLQSHFELFQSELKQEWEKAKTAAGAMGAGAGFLAVGGIMGMQMLVELLHASTRLPRWVCYGLVAGGVGAAGVSLLARGREKMDQLSLVPEKTMTALKEDADWAKEQFAGTRG